MVLNKEFIELLKSSYVTFDLMIKDGQVGAKRSKSKGSSVEFSDYREYSMGDDFRRIDWNAYARFEKLFVKLFLEEREARVNVFIDTSKSMGFYDKDEAMSKVAAAFSYFSLASYDSVSLYNMNTASDTFLKGLKGSNAFYRVISYLEDQQYDGQASIYQAITKYQSQILKGMTVIVSDFLGDYDLDTTLKLLKYKKQEVYLIHVQAREELEPNFEEHVRLIDSENGNHLELMLGSDMIRIYEKAVKKHSASIQKVCQKYRAHYLTYDAKTPFDVFLKQLTDR